MYYNTHTYIFKGNFTVSISNGTTNGYTAEALWKPRLQAVCTFISFGRHHILIDKYNMSVSQIITDLCL